MEKIIQIDHLNKSFGEVRAVNNLSFEVRRGELFAFLGVNGAGKSTTISILCGQLERDSGTVIIDNKSLDRNIDKIKSDIGVVFQNSLLDKPLTVKDNLRSRAALYGIKGKAFEKRLEELTALLDFKSFLNRPVGKLSGGQRRRVDIARALLHNPKILILDEPTTGLDPQTRRLLWQVITDLRKTDNMTVFLTTHYMEEAADADFVVIIDEGKKIAEGTPLELKNTYTGDYIKLYGVPENKIKEISSDYEKIPGGYKISVANISAATALIVKYPALFTDYEVIKGNMDDVFLAATGKKLGGGEEK